MKSLLRALVVNVASLYLLTFAIPAIILTGGMRTYVIAALTLLVLNLIVKPVINLLLLPLNILTLGMFRWVTNTVIIWLTSVFVKDFHIGIFHFLGISYQGIVLPVMTLSAFWTTVVAAFMYSLLTGFLDWIMKE